MHELSFSEVSCPQVHVVLGISLPELSIGTSLLLSSASNPLLWTSEAHFNSLPYQQQISTLIEAVLICSAPYTIRIKLAQPSFLGWRMKLQLWSVKFWHWKRRLAGKTDWAAEIALFRNYLNAARVITDYAQRREGFPFLPCVSAEGAKGRALGGPYEAALIQFLLQAGLAGSEVAALEYPLALAQMHYLTYLEREGALKIINAAEMEFEEGCRAQDEKAANEAGFATVEEHVAHLVKVENGKKHPTPINRGSEAATNEGLATAVPEALLEDGGSKEKGGA